MVVLDYKYYKIHTIFKELCLLAHKSLGWAHWSLKTRGLDQMLSLTC